MNKNKLLRLTLASLFLSLAYIFPFITGNIPELGSMLCPMHIPVLLCGFICGWQWGLAVGFIAPLFRSLTIGMPPIFPTATAMAFELAVYGLVAGICYKLFPKKKGYIYVSLIISMVAGRLVWGLAMLICMGIKGEGFTLGAFFGGALLTAYPGIILQIILVPLLVMALDNKKVLNLED